MQATLTLLAPPPKLTISEWADAERKLSPEASAEPGQWDTSRAEYLRDIMDAVSDPLVQRVVVTKAAQVGYTEFLNNTAGFYIAQDPAPILVIQPTLDMAEAWSKDRLAPMIRDTPALRGKVRDPKSRNSGNTLLQKIFPGGHLTMIGANTPAALASRPIRIVLADEINRYPISAGTEGDPLALAAKRQTTFWNRKTLVGSTPTVTGACAITREWEFSDKRRYQVPCPHCDHPQVLRWEQVKWDEGQPESARYCCEECGTLWSDAERWDAVRIGQWVAEAPFAGVAGFHIPGFLSPWLKLEEIVREFLKVKDDPSTLQVWVNTVLGEPWQEAGEQVEWERVHERRETWRPGTLPRGVTLLNGAVDVQASPPRLELHVWGWGEGYESWAIERRIFNGHADDPHVWRGVDAALDETWPHESGASLRLDHLAVDTGDQTTAVYSWIAKQDQNRVFAVKGKKGYELNAPVATPSWMPLGRRKKAIALRSVTGDVFKAELYRFLALTRPADDDLAESGYPPGFVHIPDFLDAEWCKQLVAEKRHRARNGRFSWLKQHPRNEALDCRVYCRAALWVMGVAAWRPERWKDVRVERGLEGPEALAAVPRPPRSAAEQVKAEKMVPIQTTASGRLVGRSPREQALLNKYGAAALAGSAVAKPSPSPSPEKTKVSWAALLKRKAA